VETPVDDAPILEAELFVWWVLLGGRHETLPSDGPARAHPSTTELPASCWQKVRGGCGGVALGKHPVSLESPRPTEREVLMAGYTIKHMDEVEDVLGDYPGEMRMMASELEAEQVAFTFRR